MTQWGLDTLFNPAKRHMDEEKQRLQSTREEIGDSSGGKRIDLESGKVTIRRGASAEADDNAADGADDEVAQDAAEHVDADQDDVEQVEAVDAVTDEAVQVEAQPREEHTPDGPDPDEPRS